MSKMCKPAAAKSRSLGSCQQISKAHTTEHKPHVAKAPSEQVILLSPGDEIALAITRNKGKKRTSPVASFSPGQKAEKKRSTTNESEPPKQNWVNVLTHNSMPITKDKPSKRSEDRETIKNTNTKKQQKSTVKHPMKSGEKHSKACCPASSVLVKDSAVQYPEIYNPKLTEFNSTSYTLVKANMLALIKQLQDLVNKKDKRICEIFAAIEEILQKIPDLETKEDSNAASLKDSNKTMNAMRESFMFEREKLQSKILKRNEQLEEADQKYSNLESRAKILAHQLDEATREKSDMTSVVTKLRQQIENDERIITDLRTDLNTQTKLAEKNFLDNKRLTMEIDKLSVLSAYKETQISNYRSTVKELQNQIAKQLTKLNEICMKEGSISPTISIVNTGRACSTPTSSFSDDSNKSPDLLNVVSMNSISDKHTLKQDAPVKDDFVSLLDGESSHSVMPDQNEGSTMESNNENNTVVYQPVDRNDVTAKKSLRRKENDIYEIRKLKEKQNDNAKNLFLNASKALESIVSTKSTVSDTRKQGDMQNRKPVNVPSPLQDCPQPDWSDSSLPSVSTVSNLDTAPSNDVK
ncbi:PREDICTED: uncharacterized protein PFB0145c-like [Vollenhovia emeryi]|uniref:uncharacterized protein PFB0145c-like n=1 Tax=Vollenhovia emeryi TaxID=411798 RepID=UPI0005F49E88|nr:PREDICTED: uncharacterized protein PFB0145c-like [Vollenhovia emeryi]